MAYSTTLCQQNRIQQEHTGILKHHEHHKAPINPKSSKPHSAPHSSKRGSENQDLSASDRGAEGVSKLKGVSRLPVLAKSLQPALAELSQSPTQMRWEERPLLGKSQKRRLRTKPVPFSLSQSKASRNADRSGALPQTLNGRLLQAKTLSTCHPQTKNGTATLGSAASAILGSHSISSVKLATQPTVPQHAPSKAGAESLPLHIGESRLDGRESESQTPALEAQCSNKALHGFGLSSQTDISTQLRSISIASSTQSALTKYPSHSETHCYKAPLRTRNQTTGAPQSQAVCSIERMRCRPPVQFTASVQNSLSTTEAFCPDPSALRSILQLESVSAVGTQGKTPRVSTCPSGRGTSVYLPQRVSVMKSGRGVEAPTGSAMSFSPDPGALCSILQNEGVRAGRLLATPTRVSAQPSGRGTSVYMAKRVPVSTTRRTEAAAAAAAVPLASSQTPAMKWTPQRVQSSRPQSMRRLLSTHRTPFHGSPWLPGLQGHSTELKAHQEEDVVQRLFEETEQEEDEQMDQVEDKDTVLQAAKQLEYPVVGLLSKHEGEQKGSHSTSEKENKHPVSQTFFQAPHRESVIVFSSGQRLFGPAPAKESVEEAGARVPGCAGPLELHGPSTVSLSTAPAQTDRAIGSEVTACLERTNRLNPTAFSQPKGRVATAPALSSAVSALRRRRRHLLSLEEIFLDDECATYMSRQKSGPAQPRCGNPVATTLLFQESTYFLPIGLASPAPQSPASFYSSPIRA